MNALQEALVPLLQVRANAIGKTIRFYDNVSKTFLPKLFGLFRMNDHECTFAF